MMQTLPVRAISATILSSEQYNFKVAREASISDKNFYILACIVKIKPFSLKMYKIFNYSHCGFVLF